MINPFSMSLPFNNVRTTESIKIQEEGLKSNRIRTEKYSTIFDSEINSLHQTIQNFEGLKLTDSQLMVVKSESQE